MGFVRTTNAMARRDAYLVFLIPVIVSVPVAAYVLYDVVQQPGRHLDMSVAALGGGGGAGGGSGGHRAPVIDFVDVSPVHHLGDPMTVRARISDAAFDCGDIYITIYDSLGKAVVQNAFFDQCFTADGSHIVPTVGEFSESVDKAGRYRIVLDILDANQRYTESASVTVDVRQG